MVAAVFVLEHKNNASLHVVAVSCAVQSGAVSVVYHHNNMDIQEYKQIIIKEIITKKTTPTTIPIIAVTLRVLAIII